MEAIKTEVEQVPQSSTERQPEVTAPDRDTTLNPHDRDARQFSPDPMGQTDRYRLVTPYRLPRLEV
jgi:hypothetical protein